MLEVRPEILIRLRNQARALRDVGKARNDGTQKIFCSCCCEYFKDGDDRRSIVAHMHEDCIDQLLSPDGKPVVGSKPPRPPRLVKDVADEVIARLKPTLDRWEKAVERLEEMLNDA